MNETAGKIIIDGNAACALGAMFAGVTVVTWYPITPSSSLVESLIGYMKRFRHDPETGKATYAIVQAEDELASIGMALGAGWAGARSMTATAGPGISLMSEFIGLGYYAEIPAVIFDVERVGPSTGLPTRTQQGDMLTTALLSHGDTKHPMFFPCSPEECFSMAIEAFDFAEKFQTPVFVMTDLDLGMNNWMADPFPYPEKPIARGKVLDAEDLDRLGGFARYKDVDGDGVGYRTLPGTNHPAGFVLHARQRPQREGPIHRARRRLHQQHGPAGAQVRSHAPARARAGGHGSRRSAKIGFVAFGTSDYAVRESCDQLQARVRHRSQLPAPARPIRSPTSCSTSSAATTASTWWIRTATRQLLGLMRLEFEPELHRQAAQRALLRRPAARRAHRHRRNVDRARRANR